MESRPAVRQRHLMRRETAGYKPFETTGHEPFKTTGYEPFETPGYEPFGTPREGHLRCGAASASASGCT